MTRFHLVQTSLTWEDIPANLGMLEEKLPKGDRGIVVLPEMFTTGFSMASARLAEPMSGSTVAWMKRNAEASGFTICGSAIITEGGRCFNRFLWVTPQGQVTCYDKRHLFRMADEHSHYAAGSDQPVVEAGDLQVMPQVCYDLRFPAWSRNTQNRYDVLLYVANWPAVRRDQWLALLKARAIENLCYVIGVNRIGEDGNGVSYSGDSCVFNFRGEPLLDLATADTVASIDLDLADLADYRASFPAHLDADSIRID